MTYVISQILSIGAATHSISKYRLTYIMSVSLVVQFRLDSIYLHWVSKNLEHEHYALINSKPPPSSSTGIWLSSVPEGFWDVNFAWVGWDIWTGPLNLSSGIHVFYHVIWGCKKIVYFCEKRLGLWIKGLKESRSRWSDLMAFSDGFLVKSESINIFQNNNTLARALTFRKNPMEPPQEDDSLRSRDQLLWVVMFVSVVITYYPSH